MNKRAQNNLIGATLKTPTKQELQALEDEFYKLAKEVQSLELKKKLEEDVAKKDIIKKRIKV